MATAVATVGERSVTVRELTVAEVRDWFAEMEAGATVDPLRAMVFDDCSLDDLSRMCDMPAEEMESFGPSGLEELRAKCKALNPHFFKVREALVGVSRAIASRLSTAHSPQ